MGASLSANFSCPSTAEAYNGLGCNARGIVPVADRRKSDISFWRAVAKASLVPRGYEHFAGRSRLASQLGVKGLILA